DAVLAAYAFDPGQPPILAHRAEIDRHFARASVEEIYDSLSSDPGAFAAQTLETLQTKSPASLKLAFRLIKDARRMSFEDCLRTEWAIVSRLHEATDFAESVRALIIDKDNRPRWNPSRLSEVGDQAIARSFAPPAGAPLDL